MPNVLIHKASELKAETRVALEAELGRSLQDDEEVSIMAFSRRDAPTGEARREAAHKLTEEALDAALRNVRPGYRERE
ncbi:MAG: hypothetical protein ABSA59_20920 [Terriglobia bacterium]|jgi:hypothetical protein